MGQLFHIDSPVMVWLSRLADLLVLNLLWLLFCAPVITAGASTGALYGASLAILEGRCTSAAGAFWQEFRGGFRKATALWFIILLPMLVAAADIWLLLRFPQQFPEWVKLLALISAVVIFLIFGYVFPLQVRFENTVGGTLINSCVMSLTHLVTSAVVAVLNLLPVWTFLVSPKLFAYSVPFWLLMGAAVIARLNLLLLGRVFRQYFRQEELPER